MQKLGFMDKMINSYIILLIVGFLFIGTVPKILGLSENSLAVQYRIVVLGLSLFFISSAIFTKRIYKINLKPALLFFVFWVFYSIRVINDLYINPIGLFPETSPSEYLQFAFGVTLIPSISLLLIVQTYKIDITWILKWLYIVLLLTLSIALNFRAGSEISGRSSGELNIGIILFGHYGATLAILSVYRLAREKTNLTSKVFYIFGFIIGFVGIFVSASKGPFVALILVLVLFFILWYGSVKSAFIIAFFAILLSLYYIEIVSFLNQYFNSNFLDRLLYTVEVGEDEARGSLLSVAFNEFVENPFFGNAMLIQKDGITGSYPHNIIVEAFMATGFFGGMVFVFFVIKCIKTTINIIPNHSAITWIALLFMQYFIFGMFSKNLYANDLFWMFSLLLIATVYKEFTGKLNQDL